MDFSRVSEALQKRGFKTRAFETAAQAKDYLLTALADAPRVAFGGSITLQEMGLADALRAQQHEVLWHWEAPPEQRPQVLQQAITADAYLCSVNALLQDGRVVQIDGTGNRVGALCYGPQKVFLVVGRNKLVSGGLMVAVARIKRDACPRNAKRLGLNTPCAQSGTCDEERCGHTMCHVTLMIDAPTPGREYEVLLIDEDLGY